MIRRPPSCTRTYTAFPYPTLFRAGPSGPCCRAEGRRRRMGGILMSKERTAMASDSNDAIHEYLTFMVDGQDYGIDLLSVTEIRGWTAERPLPNRSEERRVGKAWVRTCRSGWSPYQ